MPVLDNPNIELMGFNELLDYASSQTGLPTASIMQAINADSRLRFYNTSLQFTEAQASALASYLNQQGFTVQYNGNGNWVGSAFQNAVQTEMPSIANSNNGTIYRSSLRQMYGSVKEFDGTYHFMEMTRYPASGGLGTKALYVLGSIGQAVGAVTTGIWLGKQIDGLLYNANPDFWNSIGLSTLNPDTWGSLTNGSDSPFAGLLNFILGINPDDGTAQMYMDENALAYIAWALSRAGLFSSPYSTVSSIPQGFGLTVRDLPIVGSVGLTNPTIIITYNQSGQLKSKTYTITSNSPVYVEITQKDTKGFIMVGVASESALSFSPSLYQPYSRTYTYGDKTYYGKGWTFASGGSAEIISAPFPINFSSNQVSSGQLDCDSAILLAISGAEGSSIDGITNQPNAVLPDVSSWNSYPDVLPSLQQQYPSAFQNPLVWNNDDPTSNTSGETTRWIPVPFPNTLSSIDTQPTSGTQTQTSTEVSQLPQELLDVLMKIIQQTEPETAVETELQTPPENPSDIGSGSSPTPIAPTGSASALWSVYHPTQAQVDAFGGWLWSTNFVDQLIKVFENPMDAIISLHKVFVTPVDAGTTTIHAGHLDSEVPSAYVTQQYVYVDCGYVNCDEQFGNVFDYVGTTVSLYLPFIGIVPLNVDEVMRSVIHITYGCDLFTGAILAQVEIRRDGYNAVLYQYGGDGAVMYPVSGSRSSSFLTGLMATLGAAASVAVSGGVTLPVMAAGVGGAIASAQKQVQHSGGFSGNSGAMGCKVPYLIIERPQTKIASLFPRLEGYPTNYSVVLGNCQNHVVCSSVHVHGVTATQPELEMIEELLRSGVEI